MEKRLITEIDRYKEIMGLSLLNESNKNLPSINESETKVLNGFKGDIQNGPANHQSRALGNWQSDNAWDLFAPAGTQWYSITKGKVIKVRNTGKNSGKVYGTQVTIKGGDGYPDIFYTHLKNVVVNIGDIVNVGDPIGEVSEWGKSKSTHVHVGLPYGKHIRNLLSSDYSEAKGQTGANKKTKEPNIPTKGKKTIPMKTPTDVKGNEFKFPDSKTDTNTTTDVASLDSKKPKTLAQKIQDLPNQFDIKPYNLSSDIDKLIDGFKM
jgi:murein DD-endopeptidase MepM/ murein hydrolase activator NlpD